MQKNNNQIIKSIRLKKINDIKQLSKIFNTFPEAFEVDYQIEALKRADGSILNKLDDERSVLEINKKLEINDYNIAFQYCDKYSLQEGLIFLPEDRDLAEKKLKKLKVKYQIKKGD